MSLTPDQLPTSIAAIERVIFDTTAALRPKIAWTHAQHTYIEVNGLHSLRSFFYNADLPDWQQRPAGGYQWVRTPPSLATQFHQLREAMATSEQGAWFVADLVDTPREDGSRNRRITFDYQRRASWIANDAWAQSALPQYHQPTDADYAADLSDHPRSPQNVPNWLTLLADARTEASGRADDHAARQVVIDIFDAAVGTPWDTATIDWHSGIGSSGGTGTLTAPDGTRLDTWGLIRGLRDHLEPVFDALTAATPERGRPISLHFTIRRDGSHTLDVNYDRRWNLHAREGDDPWDPRPDPRTASPSDEELVELLTRNPRAREHVPAWYADLVTETQQRTLDRATRPIETTRLAPALALRPLTPHQLLPLRTSAWWQPLLRAIDAEAVALLRAEPDAIPEHDGSADRRVDALAATVYESVTDQLFTADYPSPSHAAIIRGLFEDYRPMAEHDIDNVTAAGVTDATTATWDALMDDDGDAFPVGDQLDGALGWLITENLLTRLDARLVAALGEAHLDHPNPRIAAAPAPPAALATLATDPWWSPVFRLVDASCIHVLATGEYFDMQEGRDDFDIEFEDVVRDAYGHVCSLLATREDYPVEGRGRNRVLVELWGRLAESNGTADQIDPAALGRINLKERIPSPLHALEGALGQIWESISNAISDLVAGNLAARVQADRVP